VEDVATGEKCEVRRAAIDMASNLRWRRESVFNRVETNGAKGISGRKRHGSKTSGRKNFKGFCFKQRDSSMAHRTARTKVSEASGS
jgi:hypothetical protein